MLEKHQTYFFLMRQTKYFLLLLKYFCLKIQDFGNSTKHEKAVKRLTNAI